MIRLGFFEVTTSTTLTAVAQVFSPVNPPSGEWKGRYYVVSDIDFHLLRRGSGDSTACTTSNGAFIPAKTPVIVELMGVDSLSYLRHGGSDGTIWITKIPA